MKFFFRKLTPLFVSICILFSMIVVIPFTGFAEETAPAESVAAASPVEDGGEIPSPAEESTPSPSASEPATEPFPSGSQGEISPPAPLAEIIEIARSDGEKAAVLIDAYENTEEFEAGVRDILSLYYTENLDAQRKAFEASLQGKAIDIVSAFHAAAQERSSAEELDYIPGEVLVVYNNNVTEEQASEAVAESNGHYLETVDTPSEESVGIVEISLEHTVSEAIEQYEANPNIKYAQPNYLYSALETLPENISYGASYSYPDDPYASSSDQWYLSKISVPEAWELLSSTPHTQITVAVLDTGVDVFHQDLQVNLDKNLCVDSTSDSLSPITSDGGSHGTHVTGIIGATANNGIGIAGISGGAGNDVVNVMTIDVFTEDKASTASVVRGINYAIDQGARVINLSLGYTTLNESNYDYTLKNTIDAAVSGNTVVVCAAGNDGSSAYSYPSDFDSCISVISTTNYTSASSNCRSSFSNYGNAKDISAPGSSILSTVPTGRYTSGYPSGYGVLSGTSMAAPVVSAVTAMMLSADPSLTVDEIKDILYRTATDLYTTGYDVQTGWGNVNALGAMIAVVGLPAPEDLSAAQTNNVGIALKWNAVPNASGYYVYRSSSLNGEYAYLGQSSSPTYLDTSATFGATYYYKVAAHHSKAGATSDLSESAGIAFKWLSYPSTPEGFVQRLYEIILSRQPDASGKAYWVTRLNSQLETGASASYNFLFSKEFSNKNFSDSDFLDILYRAMMNREADTSGKNYWQSFLDKGASRKYVFANFVNSSEFKQVCSSHNISVGSYRSDEARDRNIDVTAFVNRLYKLGLTRSSDVSGLNHWTNELLAGRKGGISVAYDFFFSQELIKQNISNEEFVDRLYLTMMNRTADPNGKTFWSTQLKNGNSRKTIFMNFANSPEFKTICRSYGISL
ncbi:DUF4214 domain-containing protein [Christensenella timonensis]|uniref:DUF4214 domain-containing protein n=1 Tax=Christensenella timonensis TaxID=1816678 RepID=UPI000837400A|nr:DUF4214 domain-containing protein [Christensenella timonensis]